MSARPTIIALGLVTTGFVGIGAGLYAAEATFPVVGVPHPPLAVVHGPKPGPVEPNDHWTLEELDQAAGVPQRICPDGTRADLVDPPLPCD